MNAPAPAAARPLLAFDTSTEVMAVAVAGPRGAVTRNLAGGATASLQLVPQIGAALADLGLALGDLSAIAFGRGPGAFTGLRTSCAVAQGLGFGLARPLWPLDSLLIVAEDAFVAMTGADLASGRTEGRLAVAMDARMDEIYGAVYETAAGQWRTLRAPALYALPVWNALLEGMAPELHGMAGSALAAFGDRLYRAPGIECRPAEADRAAALLRLAQRAVQCEAGLDAAAALPLYLRDKVALTTSERSAVQGNRERSAARS